MVACCSYFQLYSQPFLYGLMTIKEYFLDSQTESAVKGGIRMSNDADHEVTWAHPITLYKRLLLCSPTNCVENTLWLVQHLCLVSVSSHILVISKVFTIAICAAYISRLWSTLGLLHTLHVNTHTHVCMYICI